MAATEAHVKLLEMSEDPLTLIYVAFRQCYAPGWAGDLWDQDIGDDRKAAFIREVLGSGHESPLEHVKFTFAVEGVSRALTHQLVRYRIASYSQQSQRYVNMNEFNYIVPPSIAKDNDLRQGFVSLMAQIQEGYRTLVDGFKRKGITGEKAHEDARFVLPQAAETKIVVTMNCRELLHFFSQRCCRRAQWEIRSLADTMLAICREKLPAVFEHAGAKCERLGYCTEGKFSCGKYPTRDEMIKGEKKSGQYDT